jgi:hypothetical protein
MNTTRQGFLRQVASSGLFWPAKRQLPLKVGLDSFSTESFEYCARKTFGESSDTFTWMNKDEKFQLLLSKNIQYFMGLPDCPHKTANALGKAAKLNPGTVRNYIHPTKRTVTRGKPQGFPLIDKLARLCGPLKCEVWELLHPDIEQSRRERSVYEQFKGINDTLPPTPRPPPPNPS